MTRMNTKSYSELITIPTFEERFEYLQLKGSVGKDTFGYDRYLNQVLYCSPEWKKLRNQIIIRDCGRDLACEGYEIYGRILIHHLNPITVDDVLDRSRKVFDPDNLICVTHNTHNAIHYGDASMLLTGPIVRTKNDTCPWRH
nr:MAG TPA: HNH endonuclease bacteriophage, HNH Endonuclease, DNA.52A [Caudoviricetes sp.]